LGLDDSSASLRDTLNGVNVVVHAAARVYVMSEDAYNRLTEFRKVNRDATSILARLAAESCVKRFFLSSIKVNCEMTRLSHLFTPDNEHVPEGPYGLSKYEAGRCEPHMDQG
jgi:nucleoside-diphosphate-sugar epimerase